MAKQFSMDSVIQKGWEGFKKNAARLILLLLASMALNIAYTLFTGGFQPESQPTVETWQIAGAIITYLAMIYFGLVMQQASLDSVYGRDINLKTFTNTASRVLHIIAAGILIALPYFLIGLSSLIHPTVAITLGIFIGIPYTFIAIFAFSQTTYAVLENKMGPIQAIKHSYEIMKGNKFKFYLFGFIAFGINLIGFLCLFIGLIVTVPATYVMQAQLFKEIN